MVELKELFSVTDNQAP